LSIEKTLKKFTKLNMPFNSEGYKQKEVYYIYYLGPENKSSIFQQSALEKKTLALCVPLKLALTSPTSGGRSVGIFCLRTQATEFSFSLV
jgi:hypothetical protein